MNEEKKKSAMALLNMADIKIEALRQSLAPDKRGGILIPRMSPQTHAEGLVRMATAIRDVLDLEE